VYLNKWAMARIQKSNQHWTRPPTANLKPTYTMSITKRNLIVTAAIAGLLTGVAVKSTGMTAPPTRPARLRPAATPQA